MVHQTGYLLRLDYGGLGPLVKTVIAQALFMGFKHAIHQ